MLDDVLQSLDAVSVFPNGTKYFVVAIPDIALHATELTAMTFCVELVGDHLPAISLQFIVLPKKLAPQRSKHASHYLRSSSYEFSVTFSYAAEE